MTIMKVSETIYFIIASIVLAHDNIKNVRQVSKYLDAEVSIKVGR